MQKAIFIHIPRTGGTTIRQMFGFNYKGSPPEFANQPVDFSQHPRFAVSQHASVLKNMMTTEDWNSYYKFIVVRNPWERVLSHYFFATQVGHTNLDFSTWVLRFINAPFTGRAYSVWFRDENNKIMVDEIIRYEDFDASMKKIAEKFSLNSEIPHLNKIDREHYSKYYNENSKQIIADYYSDDIAFFNYKFENDHTPVEFM